MSHYSDVGFKLSANDAEAIREIEAIIRYFLSFKYEFILPPIKYMNFKY